MRKYFIIIMLLFTVPCRADLVKVGVYSTDGISNYNTIENCTMYYDGHTTIDGFTHYNVIRNNHLANPGYKTDLQGTVTISNGSPAVFTKTGHGLAYGNYLVLTTTGTLPSPLSPNTNYYIVSVTTDTFTVSATAGGAAISTTTDGSGTHTLRALFDPDPTNDPGAGKWGHRAFSWDSASRGGTDFNLIEGNRMAHGSANPHNNGANNLELSSGSNVIRYNALYGADYLGLYFKNGTASSNNRVYNNTLFGNGKYTGSCDNTNYPSCYNNVDARYGVRYLSTTVDNVLKNNLFWGNTLGDITGGDPYSYTANTLENNWCQETYSDGCIPANRGVNPKFVNETITLLDFTVPDFNLQSDSGAINAGTSLTLANGSGSSSTELIVDDALYFQDGTWGSDLTRTAGTMQADWIAIGTVTNTVQISSINYATNTITLSSAKTWSDNAPIWLYKKSDGTQVLYGSAPDIGAYEYPSTTTRHRTGGSATGGAIR